MGRHRDLIERHGDEVVLLTGPPIGPEGSLLDQVRQANIPCRLIRGLRRPVHPWRDGRAYVTIRQALREIDPDVVHTHSAKGGFWDALQPTPSACR